MPRLTLEDIRKTHPGGITALNGVSLAVEPGEFVALVGPSGSGKTTLLRIVAGLDAADAGRVLVDGRRIDGVPPAKRGLAMVFEDAALYPHLSVRDNLAFPLRARGDARPAIASRVAETAALLGIGELLERRPATLSTGQRQRVAIGRAIARSPAILLLDEPLRGLDPEPRRALRRELRAIQRRLAITAIHVTHDQAEAAAIGDRIAVLRSGAIEQVGTMDELISRPRSLFVARFIGEPPANAVRGRLAIAGGSWSFEADGWRLELPRERTRGLETSDAGRDVVLCVRPEHVRIGARDGALPTAIEDLEIVGDRRLVHGSLPGGQELRWLASREPRFDRGGSVPVSIDLDRAHWFDAASGVPIPA